MIDENNLELLQFLIKKKYLNPNFKLDNPHKHDTGIPLLIAVIEEGKVDMLRFLLDAGADVDQKNENGDTALTYAINLRRHVTPDKKREIIFLLQEHILMKNG